MGRVKEFAFNLAQCIHELHMTDEEILTALLPDITVDDEDKLTCWIRQQIQVVKNRPDIYPPEEE